ncbi:hypothetical protein CHS0354_001854 [Potamilus streckersoni]|uniref:Lipocalin n=1 Tax=Potamilus streckersoni TaxID=2493646 RepID=A0AAE0VQH0_9BIVA|nr:hypothetical protein CHS0354_001854 [Potamilus streckersoni]
MRTRVIVTLLTSLFVHAADACSFPSALQGTWTSSNYGTFTIGSSYLYMTKSIISGTTGTNFTCILNTGNFYIVESMQAFVPFTGATTYYRAYICFDMRAVTSYSYYYYQQSDKETGFNNERIVGLANGTTVTSTSQVCKTTVDVSEYHTLVKSGAGYSALVTCPDVMLGNYNYKYTDATGSYCTNTTVMDVCSNKSVITFNYTQCSQRIAYSASRREPHVATCQFYQKCLLHEAVRMD